MVACALAVLGTAIGCTGVTGDANAPIAIEIFTSSQPPIILQEFDTLPLKVRVLNRAGDTLAGAPVRLASLTPDTVGVDSARLAIFGIAPGPGRVLAISGSLASDPLAVIVTRAPDSLGVVSGAVDTVVAADSASAPLVAGLFDLRTTPGTAIGLPGDTVWFAIVLPAFASDSAASAVLGNDSLTAPVVTGPGGTAQVIVKRQGAPPQPDSVVVRASATRANGSVVNGSPVQFVVYFQ